jgi:hypothetical protein
VSHGGQPNLGARLGSLLALTAIGACSRGPPKAYPDVGPIQSFEGESVSGAWGYGPVGDMSATNNQAMELYSTVSVNYPLEVIREASGIIVRARGDDCQGPPTMQVLVDGQTVLTTDVKSHTWADYPATVPLKVGMHQFVIRFLNDRYEPPSCDRNLYIDKVTLLNARADGPSDLAAEDFLSPGGSQLEQDPLATHRRALALMMSGTAVAQPNLKVPAEEVVIRVRGDDCKGAPLLVLSIDGIERLSTPVTSQSWQEYRVKVDLSPGLHSVSVEFPNDHYEPPSCDRNLYLDSVRFVPAQGR